MASGNDEGRFGLVLSQLFVGDHLLFLRLTVAASCVLLRAKKRDTRALMKKYTVGVRSTQHRAVSRDLFLTMHRADYRSEQQQQQKQKPIETMTAQESFGRANDASPS